MTLVPHQQRVVDEKKELDDRREKLDAFSGTDTFRALPEDEQDRLRRQWDAMRTYSSVLQERIDHF